MASDYTLILGDCLDKMSQIEDGSIDMICADLPYGTTACKWDVIIPFEPLWKHYKRVIKRNGAIVLFGSQPFTSMLVMSNLGWFKYDWVWYKNKVTGIGLAKFQPMRAKEDILIFAKGATVFNKQPTHSKVTGRKFTEKNGGGISGGHSNHYSFVKGRQAALKEIVNPRNVLEFDTVPSAIGYLHPTQKPVALLAYLIRTYTNKGETVLDNVFGSGSTGEACLREGRRFIGIEKDETYYQIGVDRMARVAAELRGEFVPKPTKKPVTDLPMFAEMGA